MEKYRKEIFDFKFDDYEDGLSSGLNSGAKLIRICVSHFNGYESVAFVNYKKHKEGHFPDWMSVGTRSLPVDMDVYIKSGVFTIDGKYNNIFRVGVSIIPKIVEGEEQSFDFIKAMSVKCELIDSFDNAGIPVEICNAGSSFLDNVLNDISNELEENKSKQANIIEEVSNLEEELCNLQNEEALLDFSLSYTESLKKGVDGTLLSKDDAAKFIRSALLTDEKLEAYKKCRMLF